MVPYDGILLCNKPYGITSHDVIGQLRKMIGQRRIGHTGTLDPRATGLLVICLGRATKIAQFLADDEKTYEAEIKLGIRSATYDGEGVSEETPSNEVPQLDEYAVRELLTEFKGPQKQKVPAYSAVKVHGQRLYDLARKGQEVESPEREIVIKDLALQEWQPPIMKIRVECSKGTYIRALAHEIGEKVGCGAYLYRLCRVGAGRFELTAALTLSQVRHMREAGTLRRHLIPIEKVLAYPVIKVHETFTPHIISGRPVRAKDIVEWSGVFAADDFISLMDHTGKIMAVGKAGIASAHLPEISGDEFFKYVRVLN